jgi:hypothetical protein
MGKIFSVWDKYFPSGKNIFRLGKILSILVKLANFSILDKSFIYSRKYENTIFF